MADSSKPRYGFPKPAGMSMSYWLLSAQGNSLLDHRTTTTLPEAADIVVIGSGMTGTVVAKHLLDTWPDKKVVVLEARQFCSGATGRNAGHCKPDRWRGFRDYAKRFGSEDALRILKNEHQTWSAVVAYIRANNVDCDLWVGDTFDVPTNAKTAYEVKRSLEAYKAAGGKTDFLKIIDNPKEAAAATRIASAQACYVSPASTLNPWKLTAHIMRGNIARGVNLQTHTPVFSVRNAGSRGWSVDTPRGSIITPTVVHATNAYSSALEPLLRSLVKPRPHMCDKVVAPAPTFQGRNKMKHSYGVFCGDAAFYSINPRDAIPDASPDQTVVLFGGDNPGYGAFENWLDEHPEACVDDGLRGFPEVTAAVKEFAETELRGWTDGASEAKYDHSWSGILGLTLDGVPVVGQIPGRLGQWICAGHNGHGMARIFTAAPGLVKLMAGRAWEETGLPLCFELTGARLGLGDAQAKL